MIRESWGIVKIVGRRQRAVGSEPVVHQTGEIGGGES
jgi:hypothetical protein